MERAQPTGYLGGHYTNPWSPIDHARHHSAQYCARNQVHSRHGRRAHARRAGLRRRATQQQDAKDACPLLGGVVVDSCSTAGQIGVSKLVSDGATQTIHFHEDGGVSAAEAEASCKKLAGTWTTESEFPDPG